MIPAQFCEKTMEGHDDKGYWGDMYLWTDGLLSRATMSTPVLWGKGRRKSFFSNTSYRVFAGMKGTLT